MIVQDLKKKISYRCMLVILLMKMRSKSEFFVKDTFDENECFSLMIVFLKNIGNDMINLKID